MLEGLTDIVTVGTAGGVGDDVLEPPPQAENDSDTITTPTNMNIRDFIPSSINDIDFWPLKFGHSPEFNRLASD
jgi:hypothetical protein